MKKSKTNTARNGGKNARVEGLKREARENPYALFTAEELGHIIRRHTGFVLSAKNAGAPFKGGVTRPEWFLEWLLKQEQFVVKAHGKKPRNGNGNGRK